MKKPTSRYFKSLLDATDKALKENEASIKAMRGFRRLRNYYLNNFRNGESDESFVTWCEMMCRADKAEKENRT